MDVTVRLFASLREAAGAGTLELDLPEGATVADAIAALRGGALAGLPENAPFVTAVAREYVKPDHALAQGDELALVPPVSGGSDDPDGSADSDGSGDPDGPADSDGSGHPDGTFDPDGPGDADGPVRLADVVDETIDVEAVRRSVADPATGATVVFMGTTREVPSLEYEAYVDMAREQIAQLAARVVVEHGCVAVACVHRVGIVPLGDPSVVVAASAAHRAEAFDGARALLDAVKAQAPIWKKEHYEDGDAAWVEGTLPQA